MFGQHFGFRWHTEQSLLAGSVELGSGLGDAGSWRLVAASELHQKLVRRADAVVCIRIKGEVGPREGPSVRLDLSKTGICGVIPLSFTSHARFGAEP